MQTSLERRERRRRQGNTRRRGGSGAARGFAIALPLFLLATFILTGIVAFVGVIDGYAYYSRDLEDPRQALEHLDYSLQTVLYDRTGQTPLASFGSENRRLLTFSQIPAQVLDATTSAEDKTFWTNTGFDPKGAISAVLDTLQKKPRGASTITQQLVRARLLPPSSSLAERKIKEIIQSIRLTDEFPGREGKEAIITAYLNLNFFGHQSYGVASAAQIYFGVTDLSQLTLAQSAILASILQAPTDYDLYENATTQDDGTIVVPDTTDVVIRRNWVLDRIGENEREKLLVGSYTQAQIDAAKHEPVILHPAPEKQNLAPHFDEQVRAQLAELLCGEGTKPDDCERVDTDGFKVTTTIDLRMQTSAEKWLKAYILGANQGSKQASIDYLANFGITADRDPFNYYRIVGPAPGTGDPNGLRTRGIRNGALAAIDYRTGQVLAYAGSAGFYEKPVKKVFDPQFDVLSDGWRQPGSAFKPINYGVGLDDHTMTAATLFMDAETDFGGGYKPHDADGLQRGPLRMRTAIQQSLNIPAIKAASINGVDHLLQRSQDFGLRYQDGVTPGVSIGIGTVEVHPIDLVSAYGAIANGGSLVDRSMILKIEDSKGRQVWPNPGSTSTTGRRVMSPQAAYVMTSILDSNTDVNQNWWWGQYAITNDGTRRPAALKTGTSDQNEDLFAGGWVAPPKDPAAPAIAAMVWTGNSDRSAGNGAMALEMSAPIWRDFMVEATYGTPIEAFPQPQGVNWKTIDGNSGMLPGPYTNYTYREVFINGTEPTQVDNTKVPMDVDSVTGKLWSESCAGQKQTKGFLDLSKVDAGNANWQRYDQAWIDRAKKGQTAKFYPNGYGAPFPPDPSDPKNYCTGPTPAPSTSNPGPQPSGGGGNPSAPPPPAPTADRTHHRRRKLPRAARP